jgi:hypothetical protein
MIQFTLFVDLIAKFVSFAFQYEFPASNCKLILTKVLGGY